MNEQTKPQIKLISLFLRKFFRFNYQLLWSEEDQPAFAAFKTHFTVDECLPFILYKKNEHPYFFRPDKITKQTVYLISFDPRLITENNLLDDNRLHCYEPIIQEQQSLFNTNENYNENDNNDEEYTLENQNENRNENIVHHINENNTSEYITPESTTSAQDASQTGTSTSGHFIRVPTRVVSPRQDTYDPHLYADTSPRRKITFNFPSNSDEEIQDETQSIISIRNTSVNVLFNGSSQELFPLLHKIYLDLYTILHHSLLPLNIQTKQFDQKIIITSKLPADIMTHSITPFIHTLIQIFKRTVIIIFLNLTVIPI